MEKTIIGRKSLCFRLNILIGIYTLETSFKKFPFFANAFSSGLLNVTLFILFSAICCSLSELQLIHWS